MATIDLDLGFAGTHVLVTGGSGFIGSATVSAFLSAGAFVTSLDLDPSKLTITHPNLLSLRGDISSEEALSTAFAFASLDLSVLPHHDSLIDLPIEQWRRTFQVNVEGTFLTARTWLRQINENKNKEMRNVGLVIIGSESGSFGERGNADYASGKAAVQVGLLQSLKGDAVRVYPTAR